MDSNNYGNNFVPENYSFISYGHPVPSNEYYYKELTPCPTCIPVDGNSSFGGNPGYQKNVESNITSVIRKSKKIAQIKKNLVNKENNDKYYQRLKRLRGESYIDSKGRERPARPMKEAPCRGKAKHAGCQQIGDSDRQLIYSEFRQLKSNQAQWQFIASHLQSIFKKRNTIGTSTRTSRREFTYMYYLTARGRKIRVCREFFLSTLNVTESLIKTSLNKLSPQGICQDDRRGRKVPQNKLSPEDEQYIRKHILSFPTFNRKGSIKNYLNSNLSVSEMHKLYIALCAKSYRKPASLEKYRLIFKEYGLSFLKKNGSKSRLLNESSCSKEAFGKVNVFQNSDTHDIDVYHPNGEGLNITFEKADENFTLPSYFIEVETQKDCNENGIPGRTSTYFSTVNVTSCPSLSDEGESKKTCNYLSYGITSDSSKKSKLVNKDKLVISRFKKLRGESYIDCKGRERPARPMKPALCRGKEKHYLCDKITENERALIYSEFRQLTSYQAQWQFIASHVTVRTKNRCTSQEPSRREKTYLYYLTARGKNMRVCREFFLSTLSITESLVRTAVNKLSPQGICQEDKRGRQTPRNKISALSEEFLHQHILSFPTTVSKNGNKRYLDAPNSILKMHKMYVAKCRLDGLKPVSIEKYRLTCKEYNLVISKAKKSRNNRNDASLDCD